jgi:RNA polymerase sigma-70 factor, ECF subfamily
MDREAEFRRLYEAHRVAVHAYFAGHAAWGDRQLAADLMQEVFLRAWQHLDKVAGLPEDGQRGWLYTVARNLSVDSARHRRTAVGAQRALEQEPASRPASAVAPASTAVLAAERATVVAAAMAKLPEQQRVTLAMAAAGELNSAEIGAALGVPAGTVRYRLSLARRTLADALGDYDHPQEEQ